MNPQASTPDPGDLLSRLLDVVERLALNGDWKAVDGLLELTAVQGSSLQLAALAEAIARMAVRLEAREYALECTIEDLRAARAELERANFDALTGLPNRVIAHDRLALALQSARRHDRPLAVMYMDLDRFKWVNDNLGHGAGDELLQQVAQRAGACIRGHDTLARLGGDEFLLLLPEIHDTKAAMDLAFRVVESIGSPFVLGAGQAQIGASIGIAIYPEHGDGVKSLIEKADTALYAAKAAGRNTARLAEHAS